MIGLVNREDLSGWINLYREILMNSDIKTTNIGFKSPNTPILSEILAINYNMTKVCKKSEAEILHFLSNAYIETPINLSKLSEKTIITVQDIFHLHENSKINFIKRKMVKKNLKNADKIITVSNYTKEDIADRLDIEENKIEVIPLPISDIFEPKKSKSLNLPEEYLLYVGSGIERKNLEFLFKVHAELVKNYENLHLVLTGPISEGKKSELTEISKNLGTNEKVIFTEWIQQKNMPELYSRAKVYVQPSKKEGQGMPPIEAMACGTPAIVSKKTALPETVGKKRLMADLKLEKFEQKITELLEDEELYQEISEYGIKRSKEFSKSKIIKEHKKLYERV